MTYVALLRAINLGPVHKVRMEDLRAWFTAAGATEVVTYIASGNVVFDHASRSADELTEKLEAMLAKKAGFEIPVMLRTGAELTKMLATNPFAAEPAKSVHVICLPKRVPASALPDLDTKKFAPERFALVGRELYFCLPNGVGRSPLVGTFSSAKQLAGGTMRTWRTIEKLHELATER